MNGDISDLVGMSGEEQLEKIQECFNEELERRMERFRDSIKFTTHAYNTRYGYDLTEYAEEYIKDNLW